MLRLSRAQRLVVALVTVLMMLGLSTSSTYAMHQNDIAKEFKNRVGELQEIELRLGKAEAYNLAVANVIADLRIRGYNTANLDAAYADFQVHLENIRVELKAGKALVQAHPGFDANLRVVDKGVAGRTLGNLKTTLKSIHAWGGDIYTDMHREFRAFDKYNPDAPYVEPDSPTARSLIR